MSSDEIYSNSPVAGVNVIGTPNGPSTPLQVVQQSQQASLLLRLQKNGEECKKRLSETLSELDVTNTENFCLNRENSQLRQENEKLKSRLEESSKLMLTSLPDNPSSDSKEIEGLKEHNFRLKQNLADQKETEKYIKDLQTQLEKTNELNYNYEIRNDTIQKKLKQRAEEKNALSLKVDELQGALFQSESHVTALQDTVEELQKECEQLKNFLLSKKIKLCKPLCGRSTPVVDGVSIADISVDDPMMSPSKEDEVIGNNVILDLRENLARLTDDLYREKDKLEQELERNEQLSQQVASLENENIAKSQAHEHLVVIHEQKSKEFEAFVTTKNQEVEERCTSLQKSLQTQLEFERKQAESKLETISSDFTTKLQTLEQQFRQKCNEEQNLQSILTEKIVSWTELEKECKNSVEKLMLNISEEKDRFEMESNKNTLLKEELELIKCDSVAKCAEIARLKNELSEKISHFESFAQEKREEHEAVCQQIRNEMNRSLCERLENQRSEFESQMSINSFEWTNKVALLEHELNSKTLEIQTHQQTLEMKNQDLNKIKTDFRNQTSLLRSEIEQRTSELEAEKSRANILFHKLSAAETDQAQKCAEIVELSNTLLEKTNHFELICQEKEREYSNKCHDMEQSFGQQFDSQKFEFETKLLGISSEYQSKISSVQQALEKQTQEVVSLSIALTEKSQQLDLESNKHAAILNEKSTQLESLVQQKSEMELLNLAKETQIQQLTQLVSEKLAEIERVTQSSAAECERKCHHLAESMQFNSKNHLEQQKMEFDEKACAMNEAFNSKINILEKNLEDKNQEAKQLQEVLSITRRQFEEQTENTDKNTSELVEKFEIEKKMREEEVLKSQNLSLKIENLSREFSSKCVEVEKLNSDLASRRKEFQEALHVKDEEFAQREASAQRSFEVKLLAAKSKFVSELADSTEKYNSKIIALQQAIEEKSKAEKKFAESLSEKCQVIASMEKEAAEKETLLTAARNNVQDLEEKAETVVEENEQKNDIIESLATKITELEAQIKVRNEEHVQKLREEVQNMQTHHSSEMSQVIAQCKSKVQNSNNEFSAKIKQLEETNSRLVSQIEQANSCVSTGEKQLHQLKEHLQQLQEQKDEEIIQTESKHLNAVEQINEDFSAKISHLQVEHLDQVFKLSQSSSEKELQLQKELEQAQHLHQQERQRLISKHEEHVKEVTETFSSQITALKSEIESSASKIENFSLLTETSECNAVKLQEQCEQIKLQHIEDTEMLTAKHKEELKSVSKEFTRNIFQLEKANQLSASEIQHLTSLVASKEARAVQLQEQCEQLIKAHQEDVCHLSERNESQLKQITVELENKISTLQTDNQRNVAKIEQLVVSNETNAAQLQKQCEQLIKAHQEELCHLSERNETQLKQITVELENKISTLQTDNQSYVAKIEQLVVSNETNAAQLQKQCEQLIKAHQEELCHLSERNETQLKQITEELGNQISALQTDNQSHLSKIEQLCKTLADKTSELEDLENQTTENQSTFMDRIREGESKLQQMQSEHELLSVKMSQLEGDMQLKCKEVEVLTMTLLQKTSEFETFSQSKSGELEQKYLEMQESLRSTLEHEMVSQKQVYETSLKEVCDELSSKVMLEQENLTKIQTLAASLQSKTEELEQVSSKANAEIEQLKESARIAQEDALQAQKKRYKIRIEEINETIQKQYRSKLEDCMSMWKKDAKEKDSRLESLKKELEESEKEKSELKRLSSMTEEKYGLSKKKLNEMVEKMNEVVSLTNKEKEAILAKYRVAKETIKKFMDQIKDLESKLAEQQKQRGLAELRLENEQLKKELCLARTDLRNLKVQNIVADSKIREMQQIERRESMNLERPSLAAPSLTDSEGFKRPTAANAKSVNTPGRTKAGRTQSEASMMRRPPLGAGSLFFTDEEQGEMFSSSYLSDLKAGRFASSSALDTDRISELARRNSMTPAHLRSVYPAETQFRPTSEFNDDELREGKIHSFNVSVSEDINDITNATANLSVDSPAMNTRRKSFIKFHVGGNTNVSSVVSSNVATRVPEVVINSPAVACDKQDYTIPPPPPNKARKRRSIGSVSTISTESSDASINRSSMVSQHKRICRELNLVSYSKPGPPTPARKGNRSINSTTDMSLNSTNKSFMSGNPSISVSDETPRRALRSVHDKTPLLDTTNHSVKSATSKVNASASRSMSMRAAIKTPMSLKRVMTKAFRKNKDKYAMKATKDATGTPVVVVKTPKKKFKLQL